MVGIIVLNYNNFKKTFECVDSILNNTNTEYRIYLVDNKSSNNSYEELYNRYKNEKSVIVLETQENGGYARGNNFGIRRAISDGCDAILISNNDMIYYKNSIEIMYSTLRRKNAFLVGPKVIKPDGQYQISFKRAFYTWSEYMRHETYLAALCKNNSIDIPRAITEVKWIAGCCFIVDALKFENIGMFDEHTFLYFEEYILAAKAEKAGLKLYYDPEAIVMHYHGQSIGNLNVVASAAHFNSEMYYQKIYGSFNSLQLLLLKIIRYIEVVFSYGKVGRGKDICEFYKRISRDRDERRKVK